MQKLENHRELQPKLHLNCLRPQESRGLQEAGQSHPSCPAPHPPLHQRPAGRSCARYERGRERRGPRRLQRPRQVTRARRPGLALPVRRRPRPPPANTREPRATRTKGPRPPRARAALRPFPRSPGPGPGPYQMELRILCCSALASPPCSPGTRAGRAPPGAGVPASRRGGCPPSGCCSSAMGRERRWPH